MKIGLALLMMAVCANAQARYVQLHRIFSVEAARVERAIGDSPEAFKAALAQRFARYAALHPSVLWLDDDFRMPHHPPVDFACFCPECLGKFVAKTGLKLDRAELVKAVLEDASDRVSPLPLSHGGGDSLFAAP